MCDYSLHSVATRAAKVGDKLVSTGFRHSITRGFAASDNLDVAVCLMPGTELAFEREVEGVASLHTGAIRNFGQKVARFRQVNQDNLLAHHDALEFPNGEIVLVTNLREGQAATVLQLPSSGQTVHREKEAVREAAPQELIPSNG